MLSLTYVSSATETLDADGLVTLLEAWRPNNAAAGLTGMLLYADGNIIQTLEGPDESVDDRFAVIEQDPRHRGVIVILREPVEERAFPDWSMGFRRFGRADLDDVEGLNAFMSNRTEETNAGSALRLLEIFRSTMR